MWIGRFFYCKVRLSQVKSLLKAIQFNQNQGYKGIYMAILKLDKHDEAKEIEFELNYLTSLTTQQRFELMFRKTEEMLRLLKKDGRRKTTEIIKREPD